MVVRTNRHFFQIPKGTKRMAGDIFIMAAADSNSPLRLNRANEIINRITEQCLGSMPSLEVEEKYYCSNIFMRFPVAQEAHDSEGGNWKTID